MVTDALFRLFQGAEIIQSTYEIETGKIGDTIAVFKSPINIVREYYSTYSACQLGDLYDAMEDYEDARFVYSINNAYIVIVCEHRTLAICYHGPTKDHFYDYGINLPSTVAAGFVVTRPGVLDHYTRPYKLPYSPDRYSVFLHGMWIPLDFLPEIDINQTHYLTLKNTDKQAILIDAISKKEVFL